MTRSQEARERCLEAANNAVIRYVVTHIGRHGMRTLAEPAQGRFTYETAERAQQLLDAIMQNNSQDRLKSLYGLPLEVRPCKCWPVHFDPMGVYFDTVAHSSTLGGLVSQEGWYVIDAAGDGDVIGPFETRDGAALYSADMRGQP